MCCPEVEGQSVSLCVKVCVERRRLLVSPSLFFHIHVQKGEVHPCTDCSECLFLTMRITQLSFEAPILLLLIVPSLLPSYRRAVALPVTPLPPFNVPYRPYLPSPSARTCHRRFAVLGWQKKQSTVSGEIDFNLRLMTCTMC